MFWHIDAYKMHLKENVSYTMVSVDLKFKYRMVETSVGSQITKFYSSPSKSNIKGIYWLLYRKIVWLKDYTW